MTDRDQAKANVRPLRAHGDPLTRDPIAALEAEHVTLLALCDVLEQIADQLPHHVSRVQARVAASQLTVDLRAHIRFEEDELFPLLRDRAFLDYPIRTILAQLEREHDADEIYAQEIAEELRAIDDSGGPRNAEMLGYMLRGFFVSQRRHIQWENTLLLPIAREILETGDLDRLNRRLAARAAKAPAGRNDRKRRARAGSAGAKIISLWR